MFFQPWALLQCLFQHLNLLNQFKIQPHRYFMSLMEKELRSKLYFLDWAQMLFTSAITGQRIDSIFVFASLAVEQHRRRISTSVVNEVVAEALSWRSPPTSRGGRQGRI